MRLVVLDRDGVINQESDAFIKSPQEWLPLPGSLEAIATLNAAGFTVVVASNQSGVGRGLMTLQMLERIHTHMQAALKSVGGHLDGIFFCPHTPKDHCDCRKPLPGLFKQIAERYGVSMQGVPAIGDSLRDIEAAQAAGARPILVRSGRGASALQKLPDRKGLEVYADLAAAARQLISELKQAHP